VSLWRSADRLLIAGDAFVTTRQDSVYSAAPQAPEMHAPPMYFTPDWTSAKQSVSSLAALEPETVITGHGQAVHGHEMRSALSDLAERFDEVAVPKQGPYVESRLSGVGQASVRHSWTRNRLKSSLSQARMRRKLWPTAERTTLTASPARPLR